MTIRKFCGPNAANSKHEVFRARAVQYSANLRAAIQNWHQAYGMAVAGA